MYHTILLCYYVETKQTIYDSVNLKCILALTITSLVVLEGQKSDSVWRLLNRKNDLILIMTPEKKDKTLVEQTLVFGLNTGKK